jgi:hypothetical protein
MQRHCFDFLYYQRFISWKFMLCEHTSEVAKIVLKIIVGEIVRDRLTMFLLDGSG